MTKLLLSEGLKKYISIFSGISKCINLNFLSIIGNWKEEKGCLFMEYLFPLKPNYKKKIYIIL